METAGWSVVVAPNPSPFTGRGTNTYVVGRGDKVVVIDPGSEDPAHLAAVAAVAADRGTAGAVLVTHHHPDHVGGAATLASLMPPPDRRLEEGAQIDFAGGVLEALYTPGHCTDHLCFHWHGTGEVFCGDLVAGEGFIVIDPPDGDMSRYLDSLRRVRGLPAGRLLPGHGPSIEEPGAYLDGYLAHRLQREAKVLAALAAASGSTGGAVTLDDVLAGAYDDVDPMMLPAARRSLLAHLLKLVADGRVAVEPPGAGEEGRYRLSA
jgi:glyoxylase-like metal-dependent hydrolase (beta-lactamase superfamily II)